METKQIPRVTAEQLHARMDAGKDVFILDVRNPQEAAEWKIEGRNVQLLNIPYYDFLEEDDGNFKAVPRDREVVVVCAKGGSSEFIVEELESRGFRAASLEGGMLAWSRFYRSAEVVSDEAFTLVQVNRLAKGCLSYAIVSEGKAMILDPGQHIDVYTNLARAYDAKIEHIVDTHLHADHISGGRALAAATGATYYIASSEVQGTDLPYEPLELHRTLRFGQVKANVLAIPTPGHTPGSTSLLVNDRYLLSGDTVFVGGLGRPDLGGQAAEWAQQLYDTVFRKLAVLSGDVMVLPAHFADISEMNEAGLVGAKLEEIRAGNEMMRMADRRRFTERAAQAASAEKPPNFEAIVAINRGDMAVDPERAVELEIGPNRCAVHHQE